MEKTSRLFLSSVIAAIIACTISLPVSAQFPTNGIGGSGVGRRGRYTISGTVRIVDENHFPDSIQVKLWTLAEGVAASTFTSGNGNFTFTDVPGGVYYLVVEEKGYQRIQEEVNLSSRSSLGIQLALRSDNPYPKVGNGVTVSVHELSAPRRAREAMERGQELMAKKSDYKGSISQFQRAVREYPDYYEAYLQMGIAYMKLGDTAMAEQMLSDSVRISDHKYPSALFNLASLYSSEKKFDDAEPLAREAFQLDPVSWEAGQELARALYGLGRYEEAETSALQTLRIQPDNAQTYLILANIHLRMSKPAELVQDLDKYLQLQPDGPLADRARQMRDQVSRQLANPEP